ncbi:Fimbrial subunit type 1 precursor [Actinomyces bovis]|uniref:Fimbrial subunit type 1 n=2 Tax=Actinomyces bovis TaxID=1658 RepID=A0ABY1VME7_9ACTO|nr:Fimbrial subunit type 1 precursor [Actinomyces bovis]VEG55093.1 Fimbrial subunit type 1 precursor [Actinomyces israelii]
MIRRSIGLTAAATLAAGALVAPALAAPNASNVDGNHASTLTVHKCEQTDNNGVTPGNGNAEPPADCKALDGVEFTITELDYDLTTQKGWVDLAKANGDVNTALTQNIDGDNDHKTGTKVSITTANGGVAQFSDAQTTAGKAYLVSETKTPAGVIPAADFIVTLPMTNPGNTSSWNYDVHVYPKNTINGVKKEVEDSGQKSGSGNALTYTITTSIPKVGDEGIKKYQVIDVLDPRVQTGLTPEQLNPQVTIENLPAGAAALEANDYQIVVKPSTLPNDKHNYLTVDFTATGLKKLADARAKGTGETKVKIVLTATFPEGTDLNGGISNTASLIPNDSPNYNWDKDNPNPGGDPNKPTVPGTNTDPVVSKYGQVELTKTGTDNLAAAKYNGAQFQIYECSVSADDAALAADKVVSKSADGKPVLLKDVDADLKGAPLTIANESTFETGKATALQVASGKAAVDGKVVIGSLRANDWENGKAKTLDKSNWYCLVETKAPTGYSLAPDPIPFRVLGTEADQKIDTKVTVTDVPANAGLHLPLTGANGVVVLTTIGGLLVLGGAGVAYYNHRRRNQD